MFEHKLLPQWFFENKDKFVGVILQDKTVLYKMINDIFQNEGMENPYISEQFDLEAEKITEEVMMLKIIFPEPEEEPICYCSYLFFDKDFEKTSYFCIEKGNDFCIEKGNEEGQSNPFVCEWTADGAHLNYGKCSFEEHEDFLKCVDIYMKQ